MEVAPGTLRDSESPPPLLRRVAAEVFRLASISRPLMRPRRGVGVSPPGIISRRRRIHPVDRNNNKQFSGPVANQLPRPVPPYCFRAQKDPRGRGEPAGLWPMPASPGRACNGSDFPPSRPNVPVKRLPLRLRVKPGDALLVSRDPEVGKKVSARGSPVAVRGALRAI